MERTQFTFYESFYRAISRIKNDSDRAATYDAICAYALYGTMPDLDSLPDASAIAFELIKPNLDASRKKAVSGKLGGSSKQTGSKAEANRKQTASTNEAKGEDATKTEQTAGADGGNKKEEENEGEKEKEEENEVEDEDECLLGGAPPTVNVPPHDHVAAVLADYLNRINATASPTSLEELKSFAEDLGEAVCKRAFDIALDNKKTTWPYIKAILRDKAANGVKCLADWDALEQARENQKGSAPKRGGRKEMVPGWMKEEGKSDMAKYAQDLRKRTAANDPELVARAEELRKKLADKGEKSH